MKKNKLKNAKFQMKRFIKLSFISLIFSLTQGLVGLGFVFATPLLLAQNMTAINTELRVLKEDENLVMSTPIQFTLPVAVEEALRKGVPIYFVAHVDVSKERWYWTDKEILSVNRYYKLVYQPLTRRWRLNISSIKTNFNEPAISLPQWFDQLEDALAAINRAGNWKLLALSELEPGQTYKINFRLGLDTAALPKPLQIGLIGQSDWVLQVEKTAKFSLENLR